MATPLRESIVSGKNSIYNTNDVTASGILIVCPNNNSIVLGRRSSPDRYAGHWCIFGGGVEVNETPLQGAIREIGEEAGIRTHMISTPVDLYMFDDNKGFKFQTFFATTPSEFDVKLNNEHDSCGWFKLNSLPKPLHPGFETLLKDTNYLSGYLSV